MKKFWVCLWLLSPAAVHATNFYLVDRSMDLLKTESTATFKCIGWHHFDSGISKMTLMYGKELELTLALSKWRPSDYVSQVSVEARNGAWSEEGTRRFAKGLITAIEREGGYSCQEKGTEKIITGTSAKVECARNKKAETEYTQPPSSISLSLFQGNFDKHYSVILNIQYPQ